MLYIAGFRDQERFTLSHFTEVRLSDVVALFSDINACRPFPQHTPEVGREDGFLYVQRAPRKVISIGIGHYFSLAQHRDSKLSLWCLSHRTESLDIRGEFVPVDNDNRSLRDVLCDSDTKIADLALKDCL
jgi:hypothetical protein